MKNSITVAQQAKRIQNKYKGRTDELSMKSMHAELAALEAQQEALRQQMNLDNSQEMYAWGGPGGYVNQPDNNLLAMGGLIKRADGSYSQTGLWDNIRANKGSGKKPTKQMLEQEKKIKQMAMGGYMYKDGGNTEEYDKIRAEARAKDSSSYNPQFDVMSTLTSKPGQVSKTFYIKGKDYIDTVARLEGSNIDQYINRRITNNKQLYDNPKNLGRIEGKEAAYKAYLQGKHKPLALTNDQVQELGRLYQEHGDSWEKDFNNLGVPLTYNLKESLSPYDYQRVKSMGEWYKKQDNSSGGLMNYLGFGKQKLHADGGKLPKEILRSRVESHMSPEEADDYINEYGNGGYTVKRSSDRKGKTHVVIGPDGTKKYFGDSNLGQHPNDPARKKAFYARHKKNLAGNPYFRAFARKTWADGGEVDPMNFNYGGIAQAFDYGGIIQPMMYAEGGSIHIDPSKKGTFTAAATKHGKSVQGFASQVLANKENYSPAMVKKANFAKNASKWKHAYGGPMGMYFAGTGDEYNGVIPSNETLNKWNQMYPTNSFTKDLPIPNLKYQPTQTTKPTLNKPFVRYPEQELTIPDLSYKPNTGNSPFYNKNYKSPFGTGTNMNNTKEPEKPQKPEQKEPFNYLGLTQLAGPLMDLYYGIKGPDKVNFDRVRAEQINLAPQTQADLVRRGSSLPMYLAKQQGLGQGNYLNTLAAISGKAGENIGKSYLESKLAQEQFNAQARTGANATNAQIAMQESIARQQETDAARSAVTKGAGELGKGIATLSIDPRLKSAQSKQNKQLTAMLKILNPNINLDFLNT